MPSSLFTVAQIILRLSRFTAEQRSLAWSPQAALSKYRGRRLSQGWKLRPDFNHGTARARWTQARHRFIREQKRRQIL